MQSLVFFLASMRIVSSVETDNINGVYAVFKNMHYANKTGLSWGQNGEADWSVAVTVPLQAAVYNCSNTSTYSCEDPAWADDWNKLWGKARCGYAHDHHEDSDRFVFRRCSDPSCSGYITNTSRIQIGAYSYDGGLKPYQNDYLLKTFRTTLEPNIEYILNLVQDSTGLSTFNLQSSTGAIIETQYVQHTVTCSNNYAEGTVEGLYFGGTCRAPADLVVSYRS
jgi:hypothetical protein